jgi:ATP-dependent exoDNAse (exonuclease V) beta subunit
MSADDAGRLTLVGASAGSGKTHRLTTEVTQAVDPNGSSPIDVEGLVAVTYTRKAASELTSRIRRTLVKGGAFERAQRLPLAYLGTVHAACLRLVQEFAIDAGLSPHVDVLPGNELRMLAQALETGLDESFRERLQRLADGVELRWDGARKRVDWLTPVQDIMTLARSNRIASDDLPAMGRRSADTLLAMMGPAEPDGDALDRELLAALKTTARGLQKLDDGKVMTAEVKEDVRAFIEKAEKGTLSWSDWVRMQNLTPAKSARDAMGPLYAAAARVDWHPRLQAELRELTESIFEAARQGLAAYASWKRKRRVVDYVDMVDGALTLLEHPAVELELRRRLKLLVVDEFQDTSPVQLALFTRLHSLAGRSTWVGDRKQCIFEYAGADPSLMEAVSAWARDSGAALEQLPKNWRSRPELVALCVRIFTAAFGRHGFAASEVAVAAARTTPEKLASLPSLGLFYLLGTRNDDEAGGIAEGLARILSSPAETPVVDLTTGAVRNVTPGDIAVLVATNAEALRIATALARLGVRSAVARAGLIRETPEGVLAAAALGALVDARDTLALATIEALTGFPDTDPDAWLAGRVAAEHARRRAYEEGRAPAADPTTVDPLAPLRADVESLSPSEALDRVLAHLDLATICSRWPDPDQRLANLDALRALAAKYEDRCVHQREAATITGLLRFFDEAAEKLFIRDEELASDDQHVEGGDRAVTIVTYHRAKGLEWPVVVLSTLNKPERRTAFDVCPETDQVAFDATEPLAGRRIRYWPWPYGQQKKTRLAGLAEQSAEGLLVAQREERERVRLLYVGFTRARDHLVLAVRKRKSGLATAWLDELCDDEGQPLVDLPADAGATGFSDVGIRGVDGEVTTVRARHWELGGAGVASTVAPEAARRWFATAAASGGVRVPYWVAPSRAATEWVGLPVPIIGEVETIGPRLPLGKERGESDVVGNAVHAFLAADLPELTPDERLALAARILGVASLLGMLAPATLLQAGDQLRAWVGRRWPGAIWHRELPVSGMIGAKGAERRVEGVIDLLLETAAGVVIVDHKSFPGGSAKWLEKAAEFAPQLGAYAEVLRMAGKNVLGAWVSFAVGGGVVELKVA